MGSNPIRAPDLKPHQERSSTDWDLQTSEVVQVTERENSRLASRLAMLRQQPAARHDAMLATDLEEGLRT